MGEARFLIASCGAIAISLANSPAPRAEDFFAGKTIVISTYDLPNEGYSQYVQLLTRHYGRYIPGRPNLVAANKPGGGGLTAINHAGVERRRTARF